MAGGEENAAAAGAGVGWWSGRFDPDELAADRDALRAIGERFIAASQTDLNHLPQADIADVAVELVNASEQAARLTGAYMRNGERAQSHLANGEKSMVALVRAKCRIHTAQAKRLTAAGYALDLFPRFSQAFTEGRVTLDHISIMTRLAKRANGHQVMACEPELCALAALCTAEEFRDACREWEAAADPTEHLHEYIKAQARRHLVRGTDLFGNVHFSGALDPVNGELFLNAVDDRHDALYRQDQADGTERSGSQRAADALMDLVLDGAAAPPGAKRPEPLIEIVLTQPPEPGTGQGPDTPAMPGPTNVYPQTLDRKLIPYQVVAQLAKNAKINMVRVVPDGSVIDDTIGGRHFTPHQKRLIRLRDRHCTVFGCNTKAKQCEYDHIQPHERDGPTSVTNGQLLCRFHHKWKHRDDPKPHKLGNIQLE